MSKTHNRSPGTVSRDDLETIVLEVDGALAALDRLHADIARLEVAGMFDAVPSESWRVDRAGHPRYLELIFPAGGAYGGHLGPDGRRKFYVGAEPHKIAGARIYAENRRRYDELRSEASRLEAYIERILQMVNDLKAFAERWPRPK